MTYKQIWQQAKKNGQIKGISLNDFEKKMKSLGVSPNSQVAKQYFYHSDIKNTNVNTPKLEEPKFETSKNEDLTKTKSPQKKFATQYWLKKAEPYGFKSIEEVKSWQKENGLEPDGKFGPESIAVWEENKPSAYRLSKVLTGQYHNTILPKLTDDNMLNQEILFGTNRNFPFFQQGGQVQQSSEQDAVMQFVQALAQTLQADPNQVIQAAQQNPEALKSAVQVYQQTQDIQQAAQAFSQALQSQAQSAKHGAKLNYLKALKNQCAEDEELVYFKKGGKVDCGCVKKTQEGGKAPKKESPVMKFKKTIKSKDQAVKDSTKLDPKTTKTLPNGKYPSNWTADDKITWEREHGPKDEGAHIAREQKCGGKMKKDCGGSKLKKGDKVCPKCGKVHAAGMGCSIAKFKYRKLGGQL